MAVSPLDDSKGRRMNTSDFAIRDECSHCGKVVSTYVPKGGNGTQKNAYTHNSNTHGRPAIHGRKIGKYILRCTGSKLATKHWGNGAT